MKKFISNTLGIDRAIGATTLGQVLRFATGPVTMLLIVKFLSPETQGYFYAFAGVVGLQIFLEAGFAVSIAQFAAREFSDLHFNSKWLLVGKPSSLSRLRSLFQKASRYYMRMAALLVLGLAVGGSFFFASKSDGTIPWQLPWLVVSVCAGTNFLLTPLWAILEGCNRVADVASYRLAATIIGFVATAIGIIVTRSIWVTAWTSGAGLLSALVYLAWRWRGLAFQMLRPYDKSQQLSWRRDIWGFQWRVAGTWGTRYIVEAGLPALAFQFFGAITAGQAGMSFQLTRTVADVASSWTVTKIPAWGALVAQRARQRLFDSWRNAARMHLILAVLGQLGLWLAVVAAFYLLPSFAKRLLSPGAFAGFSIGWAIYSIWLVCMHYTRAHRLEPYLFLHLAVALAFICGLTFGTNYFGVYALTYAFAIVHLPSAFIAVIVMLRIKQHHDAEAFA